MIHSIDFVALPVADMARARAFYQDTLGLVPSRTMDKAAFVEYDLGNVTLALFDPTAMGRDFVPVSAGAMALRVDDVAAATEALKAKGVTFLSPPRDSGVCWGAFFEDSEGNALALHHRYAPEQPEG
jgi:predicted enzyme related to lactoylglutathione lyase